MDPRDHRIHLGRRHSLVSPSQNHFLAKVCFSGPTKLIQKGPQAKRSGQDLPGRNFPDLRFFAEVGRGFSRSEALRRSGVGCDTGGLRGGRAADLPPGGFAEVGNASKAGPGGRESTCLGRGRANPSQARIFPTSANSRRSGKFLPSISLPDLPMALLSQASGNKPTYKDKSSYSGFSFPY